MSELENRLKKHNGSCHPNDVWNNVEGPWLKDIDSLIVGTAKSDFKKYLNVKLEIITCTLCDWKYESNLVRKISPALYQHWSENHEEYLSLAILMEYEPKVWSDPISSNNYPVIVYTEPRDGWRFYKASSLWGKLAPWAKK